MTYKQLQEITEILKDIPDSERRDKAVQIMLQSAADTITTDVVNELIENKSNGKKHHRQKSNSQKRKLKVCRKHLKENL